MSKLITLILATSLSFLAYSQTTLTPSETTEFCPKTSYQLAYSTSGEQKNFEITEKVQLTADAVTASYNSFTNRTAFTFNVSFTDVNANHSLRLTYGKNDEVDPLYRSKLNFALQVIGQRVRK